MTYGFQYYYGTIRARSLIIPNILPIGGQTKEEVIETNERLRAVRIRLDGNYDTAKKALITLMVQYNESKAHRNVFTRYTLLKTMIKVCVKLIVLY